MTDAMPKLDWEYGAPSDLRAGYATQRAAIAHEAASDVAIKENEYSGLTFVPHAGGKGAPVLYFHGGGWIVGSPQTHITLCSWLAKLANRRVISVPYRLAPEHKYPAQRDDARARLVEVRAAEGQVFIAGDSAGGAMALWAGIRDVLGIACFYGAFGVSNSPSMQAYGPDSDGLSHADVLAMYRRLGLGRPEDIRRDFSRAGPPLLLLAAGADPLRDDTGIVAAEQDRKVTQWCANGEPHAFLQNAGSSDVARHWLARTGDWMREIDP